MRLFAAIDLHDPARDAILRLTKQLAGGLGRGGHDLRWTPREQLHLTLAFIGDVDDDAGALVVETMTPPIPLAPYTLALGGLGMFPPRGRPRVLWVGSTAGAHETIELQRHITARLAAIGVELERRPFHAHLTIGRWRESRERDRRTILDSADTGEIARVTVDHVTLYQSRLSPAGATHTALVTTVLRRE